MYKVIPHVLVALGFSSLGSISALAQTYWYTYTGNDFTSASAPYTTSDIISGSIVLSAPLGDNYAGSPTDTLLSYVINDGVYQVGPFITDSYLLDCNFTTDSSGDIVAWNFEAVRFSPPPVESITIQTQNISGDVGDTTSIDSPTGHIAGGNVSNDPGEWVETIVPEPSVGLLFVSFAALVLASGRFKPIAAPSTLGK